MLFKELKELFIAKPILKIYILSLLIVVKIDILDFVLSIYLVQKYLDRWYLVIYYSSVLVVLFYNYSMLLGAIYLNISELNIRLI